MKDTIINKLKNKFGTKIEEIIFDKDELTFIVNKESITDICIFLKNDDELKFNFLSDICGLDRNTEDNRFEVVYNIWSDKLKYRIRLRSKLSENDIVIDSITSIWKSAEWYERETFDMFGIEFRNHPDMRRIYMPDEFEYFPLRKDFPLMGIPDSLQLPRRN